MGEINSIENKLFLTKDSIDFKEVVDEFLGENPPEEEIDKLEFRKAKTDALLYRFKTIYGLDILEPQDGCSVFNVKKEDEYLIKIYLHRFLVHKSKCGGTGASSDGSGKLFEEISANAVKNFLGENAKSILTGEAGDNLSPEFLKKITTTLQEKEGVLHNLPSQAKDDGVDFIIYKALDDRDVGNLIVLGQSCIGKNYKYKKVIHDRWQNEYISFAVKPPTKVLSLVHYLEKDELRQTHSNFGNAIVFDRGRIIKYFNSEEDENLNDKIKNFVKNNIVKDE